MNAEQLLEEIKRISSRGNSAEVKVDKEGRIVIYEIKKKKLTG